MELLTELAALESPLTTLPPAVALVLAMWLMMVGSSVGSFLNVVIARVPKGESVVHPRSRCPQCHTMIAWYDNIPLLSWLLLRARCRQCGTSISARYPFVELVVGLIAVAAVAKFGVSFRALEVFAASTVLVAAAFIDIDTWTIPYFVVVSLVVIAGLGTALEGWMDPAVWRFEMFVEGEVPNLASRVLGGAVGFLGLWAFAVLSTTYFRKTGRLQPDEEAMGLGDALLLGGMGAVVGLAALPLVLFAGSLQGAVVGIIMRATGAEHPEGTPVEDDPEDWIPPKGSVQFGPFLALAGIEVAFFGRLWLEWLAPYFRV